MKVFGYLVAAIALVSVVATGCGGGKSKEEQALDSLNRGLQAHADGRFDDAAAAYREVIQKDPQNKFAFYDLGLVEQIANRLDSAENNYRLALNVDPDYVPALYNLAILRTKVGATQEAIDLYRHVLKVHEEEPKSHYNLGLLLRSIGKTADGDAEIARARSLDPSLPPPPEGSPAAGATPVATVGTGGSGAR